MMRILLGAALVATFVKVEPAPYDVLLVVAFCYAVLGGVKLKFPPWAFLGAFLLTAGATIAVLNVGLARPHILKVAAFHAAVSLYLLATSVVFCSSFIEHGTALARRVLDCFSVSAIVSLALTFLQWSFGFFPDFDLLFGGQRFSGFFKDPNVFGPFCAMCALYCLCCLFSSDTGARKIAYAIGTGLLSVGVLASVSRGASISLALSLLVVVFLFRRRVTALVPIVFGLSVLGIWLQGVWVSGGVQASAIPIVEWVELARTRAELQGYDDDRFAVQLFALEKLPTAFLGHGPRYAEDALGMDFHNTYLTLGVEYGHMSLVGWIILFVVGFRGALAAYRSGSTEASTLGAFVISSLICTSLNALVVDITHWRHVFFLIGLGSAAAFWSKLQVQAPRRVV